MKYTLRVPGVRKNADFSPVQPGDFVQTRKNGAAQVAVSIRTGGMQGTLEDMLAQLKKQRTVVDIRRGV